MSRKSEPGWRPEILEKRSQVFSIADTPYFAKLDQNESGIEVNSGIKEFFLEQLKKEDWRRYPQNKLYREAKRALADYIGVKPGEIMITSGGDQSIQSLFIISKSYTLIFEPTYPMFRLFALHSNKKLHLEILGPEFKINPEIFKKGFDLVNIVSPNNPTGNIQDKEIVQYALEKSGLVLVDEAYFEFSDWTVSGYLKKFKNLFITRTFSKALSMAGLRMGYCISREENIDILEKIMFSPYNVNILTLTVCKHIKYLAKHVSNTVKLIKNEQVKVEENLNNLKIKFLRSEGNFISFIGNEKLYKNLCESGIRVRNVSTLPGMEGYLRVTIGGKKENSHFLRVLSGLIKK